MSEEWDTNGYDGGFVSDGRSKKYSSKRTKIPRFRSIIRPNKRSRRRRVRVGNDSETTILMWGTFSFLVSAVLHTEWVFMSFYGIFILYTIFSKDIKPIRFVSSSILVAGILFFIAITLVVLLDLLGDADMLQEPSTRIAYTYIVGVPSLSWAIVRLLESWIYSPNKKEL